MPIPLLFPLGHPNTNAPLFAARELMFGLSAVPEFFISHSP